MGKTPEQQHKIQFSTTLDKARGAQIDSETGVLFARVHGRPCGAGGMMTKAIGLCKSLVSKGGNVAIFYRHRQFLTRVLKFSSEGAGNLRNGVDTRIRSWRRGWFMDDAFFSIFLD
ncbi:MAG: hypothetical protein LBQ81_04820 [Zoogloeaceae bacterium]|nr:hypothetical protein [Zoogloeaceae bacterium]